MGLSRKFLTELRIDAEAINQIMAEHGKTIQGLQTEEDVKTRIEIELKKAKDEWEKNLPKEKTLNDFDDYKKLVAELNGYKLNDRLTSAKVQKKYFELVKSKISNEENFEKDITSLKSEFPEFFETEKGDEGQQQAPKTPLFSSQQTNGKTLSKEEAFLNAVKNI